MTLLGSIMLGKPVHIDGTTLLLEANSLDEWASADSLEIPVLWRHDVLQPAGWVTRAQITNRHQLLLFGEWDDTFDPVTGRVRDLVTTRRVTGLSPMVTTRQAERYFGYVRGRGHFDIGDVHTIDEVSITPNPRHPAAHWLAA